ncbi:MAG: glucose-6-phosphate dehydrogenase [Sedimentisphaerales bacterium]|nr:glucose-6-phosphate dehydrogenase [Sedimentisphaerales bacterium]
MAQDTRDSESVESRFLESCEVPEYDFNMAPFVLVIFGGTGDLSRRMLLPTLFGLYAEGKFSRECHIIGVGRHGLSDSAYRDMVGQSVRDAGEVKSSEDVASFCSRVSYLQADAGRAESYKEVCRRVTEISSREETASVVYYLAVPPKLIEPIIEGLFGRGLCGGAANPKVVIEKPFGSDKGSAVKLNSFILKHFDESQVYRIDHYLGKETVQNILFFRFGNSIFEPLWNRRYVDHVQITVAESIGIEGRGGFYDEAGVVRDIVQNHMMQLLALVAMEPPAGFEANLVRDEKTKVFRAIRAMSEAYIDKFMVRGQYAGGSVGGERVCGYREEANVAKDSNTATFFAGKFHVDNWRWAGVPFYLRTGKRLRRRSTEICVAFKQPPLRLLGRSCDIIEANRLVLSIQPKEAMSLQLNVKQPGVGNRPYAITMDFDYGESFDVRTRPAYERLLLDCLKGDLTLFARADATEAMWDVVGPIISRWDETAAKDFPNYAAGSEGPAASNRLLESDGRAWRPI